MSSSKQKDSNLRDTERISACSMSWEERLFQAVNQGDARTVKTLLRKGVNVNAIHPSGRTPLGTAAHLGNIEILKMLLEHSLQNKRNDSHSSLKEKYWKDECDTACWSDGSSTKGRKNLRLSTDRRLKACRKDSLSSCSDMSDVGEGSTVKYQKPKNKRSREKLREIKQDLPSHHDCHQLSIDLVKNKEISDETLSDNTADASKIKTQPNQGYFIVVHNDYSCNKKENEEELEKPSSDENLNEPKTPDGMDNLEWDSELQHEVYEEEIEEIEESDAWIDLYRWYADYLANSCSVDMSVQHSTYEGIDVNQLDMYRRSAVHYAAEQGNLEVLHLLIKAGCCVDLGDSDDVTPLHLAAARDNPTVVALLISCGAKVNRKSIDGTGPLHMAAARGFIETAGILLEHGACVNALDRSDRTPLHLAVSRGLEDMVKLLLSHGAKVNVEDVLGYTPLCQAVWQQEKKLVHLLLIAGAKLTHSDRLLHCAILHRCPEIADLLLSAGSIVNLRDDNGDTPLILAARSGQIGLVNMLLQNGAMASYPNGLTGSTPLHEAIECLRPAQYSVFKEILSSLLNHRGHSGILNVESSSAFDVPLVRALVHDRDHAIILLIQYGADVNLLQQHTPVVSEAYLQKRPNRWIIAQLMILAGLDLWHSTPKIKYGAQYVFNSPEYVIASFKFNPMSLFDLSRLKYRSIYGESLHKAIDRSRLPVRLKKVIMLEDVIAVEDYICSSK